MVFHFANSSCLITLTPDNINSIYSQHQSLNYMVWVNNAPKLLAPVPLKSAIVDLVPLPQTSILLLVSLTSVVAIDSTSFLPLAYHNRSAECVASHGNSKKVTVFEASVNTAENEHARAASFCVSTDSTYVLIYQITINYSNSMYEILDVANPDNVLQNGLPLLHENSKHSLTNIFKSATRSLGLNAENTMINIEHFENGLYDDEQRNENLPLVRLSLAKLLKMPAPVQSFWSKPNSHSLMFHNNVEQIQLLNIKTLNSHTVDLRSYDWYSDTVLLEYNSTHNFYFHVNSSLELSLIQVTTGESITLEHSVIEQLHSKPKHINFNTQHDLVLFQFSGAVFVYLFRFDLNKFHSIQRLKRVLEIKKDSNVSCTWSPSGDFFTVVDTSNEHFQLISKFGFVFFKSESVGAEISTTTNLKTPLYNNLTDFCRASKCTISPNGQQLYTINKNQSTLYLLDLLSIPQHNLNSPILSDLTYINVPSQKRASHFHRIPILPLFQNLLQKLQLLNGVSGEAALKKPTGQFSVSQNEFNQISMAYGPNVAISTPVSLGSEAQHALWFLLHNHFTDQFNIVNHFWIKDFLVLVNRYEKNGGKKGVAVPEHVVDELMILSTASSKYGAGGADFKFDSDLIAWRHTFNNRIISFEVTISADGSNLLTLLTSDLKIIMMEIKLINKNSPNRLTEIKLGHSRISISVCRTIFLSSIRHKFPISNVQKFVSIEERHFLFLLFTGEVFLLKNQVFKSPDSPTNNMYELKLIAASVEQMQVFEIPFSDKPRKFVSLFVGDFLLIHDLRRLVTADAEMPNLLEDSTNELDLGDFNDSKTGASNKALNLALKPIIIPSSLYMPLYTAPSNSSIEILNLEYQISAKNEHLIIKHRTNRQLILNRFVGYDLFDAKLEALLITAKYQNFAHYDYCLELLLYENLNELAADENLTRIMDLVSHSKAADAIYVNLLRKIEVHYWSRFFELLHQTPVGLMDHLITLKDVELCYNYLIIYLNYKRESATIDESAEQVTVLNEKERNVITKIIQMLLESEMWSESYELCRFIKLLEPLNELLYQIQELLDK